VSDELFAAAQARLQAKSKATGRPRKGQRAHLLSGMVRCGSGHPPLSIYGNIVKQHVYYRCSYGRDYGPAAAAKIDGHGISCNVREELLLPFIDRFFAERLFGPIRMDLLAAQLDAQEKASQSRARRDATRLQAQIAEAERAIGIQIRALEAGARPMLSRPALTN
jgi:hypothetical protein